MTKFAEISTIIEILEKERKEIVEKFEEEIRREDDFLFYVMHSLENVEIVMWEFSEDNNEQKKESRITTHDIKEEVGVTLAQKDYARYLQGRLNVLCGSRTKT